MVAAPLAASPAWLKAVRCMEGVHFIKPGAKAAGRHRQFNYVPEFALILSGCSLAFVSHGITGESGDDRRAGAHIPNESGH
ncbi:MAG TPA: hypothetical protein VFA53_00090 [Xanthobacteraceae bacterium]|nr:hypothetical protein [Xanthobacteraceae bacterium]